MFSLPLLCQTIKVLQRGKELEQLQERVGARTTMLAPALKLGRQGEHRGAAERVKDMLDRARGQAPTGRLQAWRCELEEEPEPARPAAPASAEEEALARVREQVLTAKDFLRRATSAGLGA